MNVKHIIYRNLTLLAILLWCLSCDGYRDQFELDDQLYLQKSGLTEFTVFNWGTYTYKLPVIKSGKGNHSATVRLSVDETLLTEYNETNGTVYEAMPENCYTLETTELSFDIEDYRKYFEINFDPEALMVLESDGNQYVLACRMEVVNADIQIAEESMAEVLLLFSSVEQPYIGFETPVYASGSEFSIATDDDDILEIYPVVCANFYNNWDISYEVSPSEAVLENYNNTNAASARDYILLPESAYEIDYSTCILRQNRDYEYLKITLKEEGLKTDENNYAFGYYAIALQIESVSMYGIDPDASTLLYPVSIQPPVLAKTNWSVTECNSIITDEVENASSDEVPTNLFDSSLDTYWTTRAIEPIEFPYYVSINLQETCRIYRLGFELPTSTDLGNIKSGYFEVSQDGENWTQVTEWNRSSNTEDRSMEIDISMCEADYIRFVITDAFEYADPAVGKESGAVCQVAEVNAWGI